MTIKDLAELDDALRYNIKVMSYNPSRDEMTYEDMESAWLAKNTNELIEIETEDGIKLKLTVDHNILTTRGYIEAQHLTEADEIISYY